MTFPTTPTPTVPSAESLRLSGSASSPLSLEPAGRGPSVVGVVGSPAAMFVVLGRPVPQGSMRAMRHASTGRVVTTHARPATTVWRQEVAGVAARAMGGRPALNGPVVVHLAFFFRRPRSHYGTGSRSGFLRPSAPAHLSSRAAGDLDKLCRGILDGLVAGAVVRDDSQVCALSAHRCWGEPERAEIAVWSLDGGPDRAPSGEDRVQLALDDGAGA